MPIYWREIARNRTAFLVWTLTLSSFCVFLMTFYPTVTAQAEKLDALMKQYPAQMVQAFNFDRLRMSDPMGFYGTETYLFMTLFGSIYAMLLFIALLSREESEKTAEFLLPKPVSRIEVLLSKALAAFTYITLFNLVLGALNFGLFEIYAKGEYSRKILLLLIVGPYLMHLVFGAVAILLSVFIVKARAVYPVSIGVVLAAYFLDILSKLSKDADWLKYLTPFKYIDAADIVTKARIASLSLLVMGGVVLFCFAVSLVLYHRKDIAA